MYGCMSTIVVDTTRNAQSSIQQYLEQYLMNHYGVCSTTRGMQLSDTILISETLYLLLLISYMQDGQQPSSLDERQLRKFEVGGSMVDWRDSLCVCAESAPRIDRFCKKESVCIYYSASTVRLTELVQCNLIYTWVYIPGILYLQFIIIL